MSGKMWLLCGAGIGLLATVLLAARKKNRSRSTDAIDGGVVTRVSGDDAPKTVESTDICEFKCAFSLLAVCDPGALGNRVYTLKAELDGETVHGLYDWYDRAGKSGKHKFQTDVSFLESLQRIVSKHDLAKHNGFCHTVSGLPNMYGDKLSIVYRSGETIYAKDNQSGFLSADARQELHDLFVAYSGRVDLKE